MKWILLFFCVLSVSVSTQAEHWQPPESPDPTVILREAKNDAAAGDYEVALAKHLWYHENATKLQPSQSGVRRSFALSDWLDLGEEYPPALAKLREIRDATEARIRDKNRVRVRFDDFHDFTALNRTLRDEERTAEIFQWLSETNAEDAKRMYGVSEAALIKQKKYALCGRYVDPDESVPRIGDRYNSGLISAKRFGKRHQDYVDKKIVNDSAMLIAILVQNDRMKEAKEAAEKLKQFVTDAKLLKKLERAIDESLDGAVPTPWP